MLVIMPLVTGGALHNVLKQFGVRLPSALFRGMGNGTGSGRRRYSDGYSSYGDMRGGAGFGDFEGGALQSMMRIAQLFL